MHSGLLLIAMGFGFKIFAEATANGKKTVRQIGRLVGIFMMVVSFFGTLCSVLYVAKYGKADYGFMGKWGGKMCPLTGQPLSSDAVSVPGK